MCSSDLRLSLYQHFDVFNSALEKTQTTPNQTTNHSIHVHVSKPCGWTSDPNDHALPCSCALWIMVQQSSMKRTLRILQLFPHRGVAIVVWIHGDHSSILDEKQRLRLPTSKRTNRKPRMTSTPLGLNQTDRPTKNQKLRSLFLMNFWKSTDFWPFSQI